VWRALVLAVIVGCRPAPTTTGTATVEAVVDGDTIDVHIGGRDERVRLIGVDTPETYVADGPPDCYGPEASAFTATLLPAGAAVRLERDVVGRDDYGRLLAYVYRLDDGSLVNETLARQGYARPLTIEPNEAFAARFVAATIAAEAEGLGLWGACGG
jgi:endonuclease YncB( thermonuclease family)